VSTPSFIKPLLEAHAENEKQGIRNDFTMADINGAAASVFIAGSNTVCSSRIVITGMY
jgi:hypothetical protein